MTVNQRVLCFRRNGQSYQFRRIREHRFVNPRKSTLRLNNYLFHMVTLYIRCITRIIRRLDSQTAVGHLRRQTEWITIVSGLGKGGYPANVLSLGRPVRHHGRRAISRRVVSSIQWTRWLYLSRSQPPFRHCSPATPRAKTCCFLQLYSLPSSNPSKPAHCIKPGTCFTHRSPKMQLFGIIILFASVAWRLLPSLSVLAPLDRCRPATSGFSAQAADPARSCTFCQMT